MVHHVLTREELYDRVWARPIRVVALELGVSDVGLGKACRSADIPTPPRGFWTRVHHRKPSPPRPPLAARPGQRDWVVIAPAIARVRVAPLPSLSGDLAQALDVIPLAPAITRRSANGPAGGCDPGAGFAFRRRRFAVG